MCGPLLALAVVAAPKFPSFKMLNVHDCFTHPVQCRSMMPMALARQISACTAQRAGSCAPGRWKTVEPKVASRDLARATGAYMLRMDTECLYDIFYLHNGWPCACVALTGDARRVKFACVNDALALLYEADDFMHSEYKRYRKNLNVELKDCAARAAYGAGDIE